MPSLVEEGHECRDADRALEVENARWRAEVMAAHETIATLSAPVNGVVGARQRGGRAADSGQPHQQQVAID